jgi:aminomethyltransferase
LTTALRHTPLYESHVGIHARLVPFAGWEMPIQYQGILAEVRTVRTGAGIFDVSHMGRIVIEGPGARHLVDWVHTADIGPEMPVNRARYGLLCNEEGGIIDDGIVYRLGEERYLLVANAGNTAAVLAWLERWRAERFPDALIRDDTAKTAMLALQGPQALSIITHLTDFDPSTVRLFRSTQAAFTDNGQSAFMARTGYTGEDGVEVMPLAEAAQRVWDLLVEHGAIPCGLGARDTLRLEAGLPLHGSDIDLTTGPIEAGLERFVKTEREFCGAGPIRQAREHGTERRLTGFETVGRGPIPRPHATLLADGKAVGGVTSGGYSPTLDRNIGLGYVPSRLASPGTSLRVDIRGKLTNVVTVPLPFYARPR